MLKSVSQLYEVTIYRGLIVNKKMDATKEHAKEIEEQYMAARETTLTHLTTYWQLEEVCRLVFSGIVLKHMGAVKEAYKDIGNKIWANEIEKMADLATPLEAMGVKQDTLSKSMRDELGFGVKAS